MSLREQWIRPLDALPQDYQHVIAITSSGQEEEMYLVDDKWHIVDGVRIPIEFVVFWHEKRKQPTVEMAEDCVSREAVLEQAIDYGSKTFLIPVNSVKALPSVQPQPKTLSDAEINTFIDSMKNMRKATKEESKSTVEYIDSISKPTGFLFDEAYEELVFVEPHKKLSTNLQPCEDCISRAYIESIVEELENICINGDEHILSLLSNIKNAPPVTPQPKRGKWLYDGDCIICNKCRKAFGWISMNMASNFCPNCGADMREEQDEARKNIQSPSDDK